MKILAALLLFVSVMAEAQPPIINANPVQTPSLNLNLPPYGTPGGTQPGSWNNQYNANFALLDSFLSGSNAIPALNVRGSVTAPSFCIGSTCITSWTSGGTISGVTAGIGLTGGGTTGAVTVNVAIPVPTGSTGNELAYSSANTIMSISGSVNVAAMAGGNLVQQLNNALAISTDVFIPKGTYNLSGCSGWTSDWQNGDPWDPFFVGVKLPTSAHIRGSGKDSCSINVTRLSSDPRCALFANATRSGTGNNPDITIEGCTINWVDQSSNDTAAIEISGADRFTLKDSVISGNANRLIDLIDVTRMMIDGDVFLLNTTSNIQGAGALVMARFQPTTPYLMNAGTITNTQFVETGDAVDYDPSLIVLSQSGVDFGPGNTCDMVNSLGTPGVLAGNCVETGDDNDGGIVGFIRIFGNRFMGGPLLVPSQEITIEGNELTSGASINAKYAATSDATLAGNLNILRNTLKCPSVGSPSSNATAGCSINVSGSGNPQGWPSADISDNVVDDGSIIVQFGSSGSGGASNCIVQNNRVNNTPDSAFAGGTNPGCLTVAGCPVVRGNYVKNCDADQSAGNSAAYGISIQNTAVGQTTQFTDVSNNTVSDDQQPYSAGSICSVASVTSTSCLTSGTSVYLYGAGATWSPTWTNAYIFKGGNTPLRIQGFFGAQHIVLVNPMLVTSGTSYNLTPTLYNGFYLNAAMANFTGNKGYDTNGYLKGYPSGGWITDTAGAVITNLQDNFFYSPRQAICTPLATCNYNYYNQTPRVVAGLTCTQATCATSLTTLLTTDNITSVSGINPAYSVDGSVECTSTTATATSVLTISYTGLTGVAETVASSTAGCTSGSIVGGSLTANFTPAINTPIQYKVTNANSPQFQARLKISTITTN